MEWMNFLLTKTIPLLPKWMARPFALPYVAGETIKEALQTTESVIEKGFSVTLDILGEHTLDSELSYKITKDYCSLFNQIAERKLDCTVSLKLTHLGLDISESQAFKNLRRIIESAGDGNQRLTIDMENSNYTDVTLKLYKKAIKLYNEVGTVLQAYLLRSASDLDQIMSPDLHLRICKGIYQEPRNIAFQNREKIRENFFSLCKTMLSGEGFTGIATHDIELIQQLDQWITQNNISTKKFEFQVLYGVPMSGTLESLKEKGYTVRVYIPFGDRWFDYSIRRLKENPNIAKYVLRNLFRRK